jgi:hypothetical protein
MHWQYSIYIKKDDNSVDHGEHYSSYSEQSSDDDDMSDSTEPVEYIEQINVKHLTIHDVDQFLKGYFDPFYQSMIISHLRNSSIMLILYL